MKGRSAKEWGAAAEIYRDIASRFTSLHSLDLVIALSQSLKGPCTLLEIGCGPGCFAQEYLKVYPRGCKGHKLIITDHAEEYVGISEELVKARIGEGHETEWEFKVMDGKVLDGVEDGSIDVVASSFAVFLVQPQEDVFRQINRVLKDDGVLGMTSWTDAPKRDMLKKDGFGTDFQVLINILLNSTYTPEELKSFDAFSYWKDPEDSKEHLAKHGMSVQGFYRTMHTFLNKDFNEYWQMIKMTPAFAGLLDKKEASEVEKLKEDLKEAGSIVEGKPTHLMSASHVYVAKKA